MSVGKNVLRTVARIDAVGFSRQMSNHQPDTLSHFDRDSEVLHALLKQHGGQLIKHLGDGFLVVFETTSQGVQCLIDFQILVAESQLKYRIGIDVGEVRITEAEILGDAVNRASRLEEWCTPGAIFGSRQVFDLVQPQGLSDAKSLGFKKLKPSDPAIEVFAWNLNSEFQKTARRQHRLVSEQKAILPVAILLIAIFAITFNLWLNKPQKSGVTLESVKGSMNRKNPSTQPVYQEEGSEAEQIVDEIFDEVWAELEEYDTVCQTAIAQRNPKLVIDWLASSSMATRPKGKREKEHWTLVQVALDEAKKRRLADDQKIVQVLEKAAEPTLQLAAAAYKEEFLPEP